MAESEGGQEIIIKPTEAGGFQERVHEDDVQSGGAFLEASAHTQEQVSKNRTILPTTYSFN